jgi:transposase
MKACASAHYWARYLMSRGFAVVLLPPQYVKAYRRRNKTDRADCEALLEADRCAGIHPVTVKSEDQQALVALHRVRSQWLPTRTARINVMRALLVEFGVNARTGSERFLNDLPSLLASKKRMLPERVRRTVSALWEEVRELEQRIETLERARRRPQDNPGVGAGCGNPRLARRADRRLTCNNLLHPGTPGRDSPCWPWDPPAPVARARARAAVLRVGAAA